MFELLEWKFDFSLEPGGFERFVWWCFLELTLLNTVYVANVTEVLNLVTLRGRRLGTAKDKLILGVGFP